MLLCVCVCVCLREGEGGREGGKVGECGCKMESELQVLSISGRQVLHICMYVCIYIHIKDIYIYINKNTYCAKRIYTMDIVNLSAQTRT